VLPLTQDIYIYHLFSVNGSIEPKNFLLGGLYKVGSKGDYIISYAIILSWILINLEMWDETKKSKHVYCPIFVLEYSIPVGLKFYYVWDGNVFELFVRVVPHRLWKELVVSL
jgi:hypothetical protein